MKRVLKIGIILIFMLFILTGCTNTEYNVRVNKDGSGKVNYSVEFDNEVLKETLEINDIDDEDEQTKELKELLALAGDVEVFSIAIEKAQENGYTTEEIIEDDNIVGYTATKEFENISEEFVIADSIVEEYVTISGDTGIKIEENFFTTKYTQSFTMDLTKGGDATNKVKISYEFPKGFTKSNADEKASSLLTTTLAWNLCNGEIKTIEYTVYTINLPIIIIIIIVAIIILIIVLVTVLVKKRKKNKTENEELARKKNK